MKIYNKKAFAFGVLLVVLSLFNAITAMIAKEIDMGGIVIIVISFLIGISALTRSFSRRQSREDKLEELDERNHLIGLKSKSKSFRLTQFISFILMLASLIFGEVYGISEFLAMGLAFALSFTISLGTEFFTYLYYEIKS